MKESTTMKRLFGVSLMAAGLAACGGGGGGGSGDDADAGPPYVAVSSISLNDGVPTSGGVPVGTLYTNGLDHNDTIRFSISGGADAAAFSVAGDQLMIDAGTLDHAAQSEYRVSVSASDMSGHSAESGLGIVVIENQPAAIGYYDLLRNTGHASQTGPINYIGATPVNIGDINAATLDNVDMLFVQNSSSASVPAPYADAANLSKVADFVDAGGVLIFHDRHVDGIEAFLPGELGDTVRDLGTTRTQFEVIDDDSLFATWPAGTITDTSLESANSLSFGYVTAHTTPAGSVGLLSRDDPSHWITHAYPSGNGYVIYSSIPLDFYLANGNPAVMRDVYAVNVVAYGRSLLRLGPDADGDGLLDVEEDVLGTDPNASDTDGDGMSDRYELRHGLLPTTADDRTRDNDGDGLNNRQEAAAGSHPQVADTDEDGLGDGEEVNTYGTDPVSRDSDGDLLTDYDEVFAHGSDPNLADSDGGGTDDGREILVDGTDPLDGSDDLPTLDLPLHLTDANGYLWDIQEDGNINNGTSDAYDGGMRMSIAGVSFPQFSEASGLQAGREVRLGLGRFGDLRVSRRIYVPDTAAFARFMEVLVNPTGAPIGATVTIDTNLGSDGNTVIVNTSDGDTSFEATDYYVVSDDTSNGGGDPSLAHVIAGPGAAVAPASASAPLGRLRYSYDVDVPANGRAIILHFASQNANRTAAVTSAVALLGLAAPAMEGITDEVRHDIVNFN